MSSTEIIYGTNPVIEALRAGRRRVHEVFVAAGRKGADARRVAEEAARHGVKVKTAPREEIGKLARTERHQGIAARVDSYPYAALEDIARAALADDRKGFVVILDGITDPQNLGSIVRTAHLMGAHGIIVPRDNAAPVSPTVVKASAGATEYIMIGQVTNIANTLKYLKENGFWSAGADGSAKESIYEHDFKGFHYAVVLGAEGSGMRRLVRENCDHILSIPMEGSIESYNVSVAGALFMGEIARQRWLVRHAKPVPKAP